MEQPWSNTKAYNPTTPQPCSATINAASALVANEPTSSAVDAAAVPVSLVDFNRSES